MRLTLRTLLAYLNQSNLNLRAVERIEAKVKASPAASKLIDDLRKIMVDPNLPALPPDSDEQYKEANWVAEYLDNSLDESNVESFEKKAFESTLLMGEIVCCHEILSAICRNETTVASAALRQRAYEIGRVAFDQSNVAETIEIDYLGSGLRTDDPKATISNQFIADFKQPDVEFRLGPPPEESQRHEEWADAISGEDFETLSRKPSQLWPIAIFSVALILLALSLWLFFRARTGGDTRETQARPQLTVASSRTAAALSLRRSQ